MAKKKVLIFSTAYYPFVGGAEVAVKEITDRLSDFEFDLITAKLKADLPNKERVGNVDIYRLGFGLPVLDKLLLPFWGAIVVNRLQRKNAYLAFYCVMATFASGAAYIFNIFSSQKIPIVLNLQEGDSEEHFGSRWLGLINFSWRMALARTSVLTVLSQFLGDRAKRFGYKGEMKIIPNGVDVRKFELKTWNLEERGRVRKDLGLNEVDIALITTSRLVKKNGVEDVVKALSDLPSNVKFVICGVGELEESLKLKAKSLKVEDRVIFAGNVSQDILPKYLKACDIFVRPSLSEGFGISFIEAMASKLPVVATPVGGITDFLQDGETGYFCKPNNPESVADTIKRVLADPSKNAVVEKAHRMVLEKYDWDKIVPEIGKIFENIKK